MHIVKLTTGTKIKLKLAEARVLQNSSDSQIHHDSWWESEWSISIPTNSIACAFGFTGLEIALADRIDGGATGEEREARTAEPLTRAREICGDGLGFLKIWSFFFNFFGLTCLWPNPSWRYPQWIHPKPAKMLDLACVWEVLREFERDFERVWEGLRGFGECLRGFESLKISQNLSNESN